VEYIELYLKFSVNKKKTSMGQEIRKAVSDLITSLTKNKEQTNLFDTLRAKAQDSERSLRMTTFDLLADKVSSEIEVQLKPKHKVIVSTDIFEKMQNEYKNKNIL
jgi:hypothetical protein